MTEIDRFIEHRASQKHPAWSLTAGSNNSSLDNTVPRYAMTSETLVLRDASDLVVRQTTRFKKFMKLCVQKSRNQELCSFNIDGKHTWQEVLDEAERAAQAYEKKRPSWRYPLRKISHAIGGPSEATKAWLELLPQGEYTSVICGALKLVFGAAARMNNIRDTILETLRALPEFIETPESYLDLYQEDEGLLARAEELYVAVLAGIEGMIAWLDHSTYKEVVKSFFQQEMYAKPLKDSITKNIDDKSKKFCARAKFCLHHRIAGIRLNLEENTRVVRDIGSVVQKSTENPCCKTLTILLEDLVKDTNWIFFRGDGHRFTLQNQQELHNLQRIPITNLEELMTFLRVDLEMLARDIRLCAGFGQQLSSNQQQRVAWLMQQPNFREWFKTDRSQMLVVDGMEMATTTSAESSMTYFSALLTQALDMLPEAIPFTFLCGLHAVPGNDLEGAQGIMRSFLSQLLLQGWVSDFNFIDHNSLNRIRNYNLAELCKLFRNLLAFAPDRTTIFCIIDGISRFENEGRCDDVCTVMTHLRQIVDELQREDSTMNLKILVTSPNASRSAKSWAYEEDILVMQSDVRNNGRGFNILHMTAQTNRLMAAEQQ